MTDMMNDQIDYLNDTINEQNEMLEAMSDEINAQKIELADFDCRVQTSINENCALNDQVIYLQDELDEVERQYSVQEQVVNSLNARITTLIKEKARLENDFENAVIRYYLDLGPYKYEPWQSSSFITEMVRIFGIDESQVHHIINHYYESER